MNLPPSQMIRPTKAWLSLIVSAIVALVFFLPAASSAAQSDSGWISGDLVRIGPDGLQLREAGGSVVDAILTPSSLLLSRGMPTLSLKAFPTGSSVSIRLRPAARDGARPRVEILCDGSTSSALDSYAKQPLTGTITAALPGWLIIHNGEHTAIPVELTGSTLYRRLGNISQTCPFKVGDRVTVATHQSTEGTLIASSVSDEETALAPETALPVAPAKTIRGTIFDVRPRNHAVIILAGDNSQIVISTPLEITSIRISRRKASLA